MRAGLLRARGARLGRQNANSQTIPAGTSQPLRASPTVPRYVPDPGRGSSGQREPDLGTEKWRHLGGVRYAVWSRSDPRCVCVCAYRYATRGYRLAAVGLQIALRCIDYTYLCFQNFEKNILFEIEKFGFCNHFFRKKNIKFSKISIYFFCFFENI